MAYRPGTARGERAPRRRVSEAVAAHRATWIVGGCALVLALAWSLGPSTGTDLAAQIARADFARAHPLTPVDFRWFSGITVFGYSIWTPVAMAWLGVRPLGVAAAVLVSMGTTHLFARTGARRPLIGGLLVAVLQVLNLVAGRITFALGLVFAVGVLLSLSGAGRHRPLAVIVGSLLCGAASPVAALCLWVCCGALVLTGELVRGVVPIVVSAVPVLATSVLFGSGGTETFSGKDCRDALLATAVVFVVVPWRMARLRVGAAIAFVMVLASYVVDTPVGNNSVRLSLLFAVPVVAAFVTFRPLFATIAVLACAFPQQIVEKNAPAFTSARSAAFYAPLVTQIRSRGEVVGRVEVPETRAHWDAAYLARAVPLARGWLRQQDLARNGAVFFRGEVAPAVYRRWLAANSVQYVAVPAAPLTDVGTQEVGLIARSSAFLRLTWSSEQWRLYRVVGALPVVRAPGRTQQLTPGSIRFRAAGRSRVEVQVRWSRWLTLRTADARACIRQGADGTVEVVTAGGGGYDLGSSLTGPRHHCIS